MKKVLGLIFALNLSALGQGLRRDINIQPLSPG
jgi:hypothetical protein